MKLILVRHGDAGAYTHPDHERNLSQLGKAQAAQTAAWLAKNYQVNQVISSHYNRAKQTAEVLNIANLPVEICSVITPDDDARQGLLGINKLIKDEHFENGTVLVVCHMNIIAKMAGILTDDGLEGFELAQARVFELSMIGAGAATEIARFSPSSQIPAEI